MIEYIYDVIRASAGESITIKAVVGDDDGNLITEQCMFILSDNENEICSAYGSMEEDYWVFTIPAEVTEGLKGRYWYEIKCKDNSICFRNPIYLV